MERIVSHNFKVLLDLHEDAPGHVVRPDSFPCFFVDFQRYDFVKLNNTLMVQLEGQSLYLVDNFHLADLLERAFEISELVRLGHLS